MMINKRLIGMVPESRKAIKEQVMMQWGSLVANIVIIFTVSMVLNHLYLKDLTVSLLAFSAVLVLFCLILRWFFTKGATRKSYEASRNVKLKLRHVILDKIHRLGTGYREQVATSEVVQVAVEGIDQLETYFGSYLPQFFYSMLAPLTLFVVLSFVSFKSALALLLCVPLIPIAIAAVQTFAKKLLNKYWGQYTTLGDSFLENLQGLTTLKIYQADEMKSRVMDEEAENFRKVTMRVLVMQLNSIIIMDWVAYGGAALGVILAVTQLQSGAIDLAEALAIILLAAEFFIPMRQLGSYFHIAMNGMAASDKIFKLLDLKEPEEKTVILKEDHPSITIQDLSYQYTEERTALNKISAELKPDSFIGIVGESGSGKSTLAKILTGQNQNYTGHVRISGLELNQINESSLMKNVTCIAHNSMLFKGTVRSNLLMGDPEATEQKMWDVLEKVNLADFIHQQQGLDTLILEKGANLSGGQCQRLCLARALLHDSPVYIFDEATSNIDVESENAIMKQVHELTRDHLVIMISHRLANITEADQILVLDHSELVEKGSHNELLAQNGLYASLWETQQKLERFAKEEN